MGKTKKSGEDEFSFDTFDLPENTHLRNRYQEMIDSVEICISDEVPTGPTRKTKTKVFHCNLCQKWIGCYNAMQHGYSVRCLQSQFDDKEELYLDELTKLMKLLALSDFETKSTQFSVKKQDLHKSLIPLHRTTPGMCDCCGQKLCKADAYLVIDNDEEQVYWACKKDLRVLKPLYRFSELKIKL